ASCWRLTRLGPRPAIERPRLRGHLDLAPKLLQGGPQALLDDRVIVGHRERLRDGHALLDRPGQQVGEVLDLRADQLGAEDRAARSSGVDPGATVVLADHLCPTLVGKVELAKVPLVTLAVGARTRADHR